MTLNLDLPSILEKALAIGRGAAAGGRVATYIPELSDADPAHVGLVLASLDGERYCVGDTAVPFTFQSVSKVFALSMLLREQGAAVFDTMSCEPSGDAFYSIVRLEEERGRPRNPYINAGAIMVSGQLRGDTPAEKVTGLQRFLGSICDDGRFPVDEAVLRSEAATGYRNRALADFMAHYRLVADPGLAVETYFRQCSISLTAERLARLGLFLANRGVDPVSGERILTPEHNRIAVSQMAMCGLYDEVGHFAMRVGVPAKSGVSGAILAVVPGRMTLCAFGPALGPKGNSAAGMAALAYLSTRLELSLY